MNEVKILLGEERIISMAPPEIREWGPWQFPAIYKSGDGTLYLSFSKGADSYAAYGTEPLKYFSTDSGLTWNQSRTGGGLPLDDGSMIRPARLSALTIEELSLPKPMITYSYFNKKKTSLYDINDKSIPAEHKKWYRWRVKDGSEFLEEIKVNAPGYLMRECRGLFMRSFFYNNYFFRNDEGNIYAVTYNPIQKNGKIAKYYNALYFESLDSGKSFDMVSSIIFKPPYSDFEESDMYQGWLEPSLCFIDENTAFTLLRTSCGKALGPLYISWSYDNLRTWTKPEVFDEIGVKPEAIKLDNGVVLAGYGRPGLFVRAMVGGSWTDKTTVVESDSIQKDTCSYCAMAPTGYNKALFFYSRFNVRDDAGRKRKTILCREITVTTKE